MSTSYQGYERPLQLLSYHILVVLASRPLYSYALAEQIQQDSAGALAPAQGSLHHALKRLESWGFIAPDADASYQDSRRSASYTLTPAGRIRLKREIVHLERAIRAGQRAARPQHPAAATPNSS